MTRTAGTRPHTPGPASPPARPSQGGSRLRPENPPPLPGKTPSSWAGLGGRPGHHTGGEACPDPGLGLSLQPSRSGLPREADGPAPLSWAPLPKRTRGRDDPANGVKGVPPPRPGGLSPGDGPRGPRREGAEGPTRSARATLDRRAQDQRGAHEPCPRSARRLGRAPASCCDAPWPEPGHSRC